MLGGRSRFAVLIAVLASTAVVAVPASGAGSRLVGFDIFFDGVYSHGKPVKVKNLAYSNLTMTCNEGTVVYSPSKKFPKMDVNRKLKFHGTLKIDGITSRVAGKYKRDLSKVTGTVRASGAFGGGTNCIGKVDWETN